MKFRPDNGPLLAALFSLLLLVWMGSGFLGRDASASSLEGTGNDRSLERERVRVQVRTLQAQAIDRTVILQGHTAPERAVRLRAEVAGRVVAVGAGEGQLLESGAMVARLDAGDLEARLAHARDVVRQRELEFAGSERLYRQKLLSEAGLAQARAHLSGARAEAESLSVQLAKTQVRAPFGGLLDQRPVELGDYVKVGDTVATVLDFDPLLVVGHVSEAEGGQVRAGLTGSARLRDGRRFSGRVRHVQLEAAADTRTHRVEFELDPAPGLPVQAGVTARVTIQVQQVQAHLLSPALLTLDASGDLGVMVVDDGERARFLPVQLVRAGTEGAWVHGLPATVRLITVGAGFVRHGDPVEAVAEPVADTDS